MTEQKFETLKAICQNRHSTRSFSNETIPDESIQKIIEIARTSPYISGLKNWDIQVVGSKEQISQISECVDLKAKELSSLIKDELKEHFLNYSKNFSFFRDAPCLLVVTYRLSPIMESMMGANITDEVLRWERDNFNKSISCVAMLILLAAESIDLGACYMTGPIIAQESIMKIIESKPGREIGAIIPIGYKNKNL
jgi:nitroreductase